MFCKFIGEINITCVNIYTQITPDIFTRNEVTVFIESLKKKEAEHSDALEILSRELQSSVDALKKERSSLSIKNEKLNEDLTRLQKLFQEKEKQ